MNIRILILTEFFDPEPHLKGLLFAKELIKFKNSVTVLTGFPNYPKGKIYPNYKLQIQKIEEIDGTKIIRVPLYPSHDKSSIKRAFTYLSFSFSALIRGIFLKNKIDIIYAYHPPVTVGIVGILLKTFFKVPLVLDVQDMWPEQLLASKMVSNKLIISFINKIINITYKKSDKIVTLSNGFKKNLLKKGIPDEKIKVIYNWTTIQTRVNTANTIKISNKLFKSNKFNILYAGNMGIMQSLDTILYAAIEIQKIKTNINFIFIGNGVQKEFLLSLKNKYNLENVIFHEQIPMEQIHSYLNKADALILHLKNIKIFEQTIPSKIQAYMYSGKPIIGCLKGCGAEIIEKSKSGIIAEPENAESILKAIIKIEKMSKKQLKKMGERGRLFYESNMSINKGVNDFNSVFKELILKSNF